MSSPIWFASPDLEHIQAVQKGTIDEHLDIRIIEIGADFLRGTMPVDARTFQPTGRVHGGANVVLAESLGSVAANMVVDPQRFVCFGMEVNANHLRGVSQGLVTGTATPLHLGRTSQVWEIKIRDEDQRLTCISRLTMAVVAK
ncbi:hotdog fold thioesterase [Pseudomaricurvus sp. HS19]|uniref:hotdog fold thioesterase n=1 Tax=Pseudomaricurvus sp. HS19 TaxID=2692626 RepID=UPI001369DB4B|nr:hotdog fold thioesterase [Pseudomaricurvus sp. HS19]MYM62906.1 hotdog fold thioesterase [Pseudomaricurvus sp. HS19]